MPGTWLGLETSRRGIIFTCTYWLFSVQRHVTIEEKNQNYRNGAVGIDNNPHGLGKTRADYIGQYRESLWLSQGEWTQVRSSRRNNLLGEAAAVVVDMAKQLNCSMAVEDLDF